ncbi:MAG: reverse transcriptase domain-containing protein [Bacteroidota bacterium]
MTHDAEFLDEMSHKNVYPEIRTATGEKVKIQAQGKIGVIEPVYLSTCLEETILSGPQLLEQGYTIVLKNRADSNIGGYVIDKDDNVVFEVNQDMTVDVDRRIPVNGEKLTISDKIKQWEIKQRMYNKGRLHRIYGFNSNLNIEDITTFIHAIGHWNKTEMLKMVDSIHNFPISKEAVLKFFPIECIPCIRGTLRRKNVRNTTYGKQATHGTVKPSMTAPRDLIIGQEVGVDFYGPLFGTSVITFTDKASNYMYNMSVTEKGKKEINKILESFLLHYKTYNRHDSKNFNTPIVTLISDSDPIFTSKTATEFLKRNGIKQQFSAPYVHEHNGLAESTNKILSEKVTQFYSGSKHVPESLWTYAWRLAIITNNLRSTTVTGKDTTRLEAFTGKRVDWNDLFILPFGNPVEFWIPKEQRSSKIGDRSETGIYLGPGIKCEKAILCYSFHTRTIVERDTYRILFHIPSSWIQLATSTFTDKIEEVNDVIQINDHINANTSEEMYPQEGEMNPLIIDRKPQIISNKIGESITHGNTVNNLGEKEKETERDAELIGNEIILEKINESSNIIKENEKVVVNTENKNDLEITAEEPQYSASERPKGTDSPVALCAGDTEKQTDQPESDGTAAETTRSKKAQPAEQQLEEGQVKRVRTQNTLGKLATWTLGAIMNDDDYTVYELSKNKKWAPNEIMDFDNLKESEMKREMKRQEFSKRKKYIRRIIERDEDHPTMKDIEYREDRKEFYDAIDTETKQLESEGVFEYMDKKQKYSGKIIGSMWVLQVKRSPETGEIVKYKARLVALGNQQTEDSYSQIRSPTARSSTVKLLVAIQAKLNAYSCTMDVKGAYLKSTVTDEIIYLRLPSNKIVKLKKYLYGLKQAGYQWNLTLDKVLVKYQYVRSNYDTCVYYKRSKADYIIMCTHVDDFYVITSNRKWYEDLHSILEKEFGEVTIHSDNIVNYLGMSIKNEKDYIEISQPGYIQKIIDKADIGNTRMTEIPYSDEMKALDDDDEPVDKRKYLELIGMLNYLAVLTRADILYALSKCAQRCSDPTKKDIRRVKKVFAYLKGTKDYGLRFNRNETIKLRGYVDASHNRENDGKGQFGYAFSLDDDDACFYARSQKLKSVTPAGSAETEFVGIYEAALEIVHLRYLLNELGFQQKEPTVLYNDNQTAIGWVNNKESRTIAMKHINIKFQYTKELVKMNVLKVQYCETGELTADVLTKPCSKAIHKKLTKYLLNY